MDSLKNKRILVTGGKGYLGTRLVDRLKSEGAEVYTLSLEPSEDDREYQVDICNAKQVEAMVSKIRPDYVYHLAASLDRQRDFDRYEQIMAINVTGTFNLLKALQQINYTNFIFTSSSEVYGNNKSPFLESMALRSASPYSLSKVQGEHLIMTFSDVYDKNYTILRLFNFYGENMPENFFIPQIISALERNENFEMTKGEQERDFLYVEDIIQALILAAKNSNSHRNIFNVCSGEGIALKQLAEEISQNMPNKGKVSYGAIPYRQNEIWEMIGDNSKIKNLLGFKVNYSLQQGIKLCIENKKE